MAPNLRLENGARTHLQIDEQKPPTPERRQLSLTHISIGLVLSLSMKTWLADILLECTIFHFVSAH